MDSGWRISKIARTNRLGGRYATSLPPAIPTKYGSGESGPAGCGATLPRGATGRAGGAGGRGGGLSVFGGPGAVPWILVHRFPFSAVGADGGDCPRWFPAVLDRDAQRPADLPLRPFRGPFEQDGTFLDDIEPLREGLGFVEVMRRQEDRAPLPREVA